MIVIGYQGIGKSAFARTHNNSIDLESSCFLINGIRLDDWYIPYCNIAEDLSSQGNIVFVSSHESVRRRLKRTSSEVLVIVPDFSIKDQWIKKLKTRYEATRLDKDYRALARAIDRYNDDIGELLNDGFDNNILFSTEYDLNTILKPIGKELRRIK